jgi:periplasmic protein TonB
MGVYVHDNQWASRRGMVLVGIILFHVFLIYGLKSGLAMKLVESIAPPIETTLIEEEIADDAPPPPPPPKMELPPVEVPPPVVDIAIPVDTGPTTALSNVTDKPLPPAPPPVVRAAPPSVKVAPKLNPRSQQPSSDDYYPPTSKRLGEQGNAVVKACVGANGRVQDVTVQESSNIARLDEAAVKYARALRYVAGTADGKPEDACFAFRVKFELKD